MTRLFGTDGVRGVANVDLTPDLAFRLGEAAGHFLCERGTGRIVVGKDTRRSGDMLESALVAGICSVGADALVVGIVPTPAVALLTRELEADGGVVISASHNPAEFNGIKLFDRRGLKLADELEDEIEEYLVAEREGVRPSGAGVGRVVRVDDAVERYIQHAVTTVGCDLSGLRVAVDCGHGASSLTTPEALRRLGADVVTVNCEWDGMDINLGCGSTNLEPIRALVIDSGCHVGIAHDGDADRVLAVDELGEEIDGDVFLAVLATHMHERGQLKGGLVVATVMSNMGLDVALRARDISLVKTRVGDRYVLEQMLASGANLGGEQSGHVIFLDHNTTGDGLVTALQLLCAMRQSGSPLSELRSVMQRFPQVLINVPVMDKGLLSRSHKLASAVTAAERELADEGRVLVRASGTEPLVRVMVEARDEATAARVAEQLVEVVRQELDGTSA